MFKGNLRRVLCVVCRVAMMCGVVNAMIEQPSKHNYFHEFCKAPSSNYEVVWPRVLNGDLVDKAILFIGYSNTISKGYGDEGTDIFPETPKCSRTVFFNGGASGIDGLVDQKVYNHLYGDFRLLDSQFPYLMNSSFFDLIFIGKDTFAFMYEYEYLKQIASMLSDGGKLIIAAHKRGWAERKSMHSILGDHFSVMPYFYDAGKEMDCLDKCMEFLGWFNKGVLANNVSFLMDELQNHPFVERFFSQNNKMKTIILVVKKNATSI
jgi:hypothetical protein